MCTRKGMEMPVSGLVLTLSPNRNDREFALARLQEHPRLQIGHAEWQRLPVVVDTPSDEEDKALWAWLNDLRGVLFVNLVCTDNSEDQPGPSSRSSGDASCADRSAPDISDTGTPPSTEVFHIGPES